MKLTAAIIIAFFCLNANAQCTLSWTGSGHSEYFVQDSYDSLIWMPLATVAATTDSVYTYNVSSSSRYYRVIADNDTSNTILVKNVLSIDTSAAYKPQTHFDNSIKVINKGNRLNILVSSDRDKTVQCTFTDAVGRVLYSNQLFIKKGLNTVYLPFNYAAGVYFFVLQSAYEKVVREVVK